MDLVSSGARKAEDLAGGRKPVQVDFGWVMDGWMVDTGHQMGGWTMDGIIWYSLNRGGEPAMVHLSYQTGD